MAWMLPNELAGFITTKTSLPTPSTEECLYWPQEKQWVPERLLKKIKAGERKQLQRAKAIVQRAVSGQSKCRKCGGPVPKGALRVGYPTSDPRGQYEVLCCWLHVGCSSEFFSLLLQGEVEPQQHELLREDLIVRLTSLEDTPAAAAAADAAATTATATAAAGTASLASGKTPKAEDGFIDLEGSLKEGPTPCKREKKGRQKTRVSAREREAEGRGGKFEEQEDRKEAPSVASTEAPTVKGPSTASAASSSEDVSKDSPVSSSHEEGAAANQQQMKERQQQKDEERHSQRLEKTEALGEELSAKDRLLIERAGSVVSLDRLCVAEEGLSVSEQHEVHTAIAAAARRFFFPSKETEETAAAEEVLQSLTVREIKGRIAAPPGLQLPLLPFQEEGLWWLTQQEASGVKGGILADEMGMGKTIQLISLLLARPFPPLPPAAPSVLRSCVCSTLVVTPLAALLQWKSELDRFVSPGRLAVLIYHGPQRGALFSVLHEYDVVLTTYQTVEQDFRKQLNKQKKQCKYCGRLFLPSKLAIHQKYFCGPEAQRTVKQRLTERKLDSTAKAMETLNIINAEERQQRESVAAAEGTKGKGKRQKEKETPANFVPTPSNCLKELLQQANLSLSDVRPNPWLGPHFNRTARAAAETPQPPADKKRKVDRPSSSSSSSSSGGVGLSMADVGRLQVPQLRELLKALGQPLQARMTKAKLLELVEPLLQESLEKNETAAAAAAAATNGDSAAAHPKEVKKIVAVSDVEEEAQQETDGEEEQQQQQQQNAATKRRKSSRRSKQMIVKQEEGQCSADTDSQQQPKTLAPSSSSSSSSKPAFKYVKPTKPKQQQQQQKESEEDEGSSEDERPIAVSKGKAKAKKPLSAAKKAAAKTTKKSGKAPAKPQKKLSRPLKPRKGAKKKKPAAAAAVAATSESSVEDSGWESSSTAYEPSGSSSESVSSESFAASSSEEGSLASESEGSSSGVSVVSAGSSRRRRGTAGRSSSRPQQQGLAAASPIDELLWGKALGDTESEDEAQEGGRIRERLEEDPQLLNVLRQSPLHGVVWQRIVLDEAHRIKTRNSSTAQAIFALRSATLRVPLHQQQEQQKQQEEVAAEKDTQGEDGKGDSRAGAAPNATDVGEAAGGEGGDGEKKGDVPQTKKGRGKQPKRQKQQEQEEADEGKGLPGQEAAEASTASARRKRGPAKETLSSSTENAKEKAIVSRGQAETKQDFSLLVGGCRWCLTGTPLQNRVGELYSLVRFLRFYPYAYYFCSKKGCTCRSMHYRFPDGRYCEKCSHTRMTHYSFFCRRVVKPIKEYGYQGEGIIALETLKKEVLDVLLLRRTKVERAADVKLPPLTVHIRRDALSPQERDFYEALFKQTATQFDSYVKSGTVLHNFAHIFDLLSRLRQAVDHPYLLIHGSLQAKEGSLPLPTDSRNAKQTGVCAICQEDMEAEEMVEAKCGHAFHRVCVLEYIESAPVAAEEQQQEQQEQQQEAAALGCPACFVPLTVDLSHKEGMGEDEDGNSKPKAAKRESAKNTNRKKGRAGPEDEEEGDVGSSEEEGDEAELDSVLKQGEGGDKGDTAEAETEDRSFGPPVKSSGRQGGIMKKISASNFTSSTKIEALVQELQGAYAEDPGVKSIVFSQFCAMLDLIEFRLKKEGIHCAQLTGSMTAVARQRCEGVAGVYVHLACCRSNVLYAFHKDPNLRVILISLKAGGEGLNLQVASRIYLMDPWWNPAAEMQAIQRAHRIGQKRPVKGVRFICSDTIEERILQLQEKKQLVFDGTVGASNQAMHKLTQEDLRFLFQS